MLMAVPVDQRGGCQRTYGTTHSPLPPLGEKCRLAMRRWDDEKKKKSLWCRGRCRGA